MAHCKQVSAIALLQHPFIVESWQRQRPKPSIPGNNIDVAVNDLRFLKVLECVGDARQRVGSEYGA